MPEDDDQPDPVLIVGAVTWDIVEGERRPGGAVTYAARAAAALGVRAYVLTAAGLDAGLDAFAGHVLAVVPGAQTMTLEHRFEGGRRAGTRRQRLIARPERALRPSDLPTHWPAPRTVILGPLLPDDIDVAAFLDIFAERLPEAETALLAQGLQRAVAPDGTIDELDAPSEALLDAARPRVTICLSAEDTARWEPASWNALVRHSRRVVRTLGAAGAEIRTRLGDGTGSGERVHLVPALPAAVIDTTGAGDVFATALILAMRAGDPDGDPAVDSAGEEVAGRLAAACAAACVERRGAASLPSRAELEARAGIVPAPQRDGVQRDRARGEHP